MCVGMRVQGLGQGQADAHGAAAQRLPHCHGTSLCRSGGGLSSRGATGCAEAPNRVGRTMRRCVRLRTQGALGRTGFSEAPTARPAGFDVDVGVPTKLFVKKFVNNFLKSQKKKVVSPGNSPGLFWALQAFSLTNGAFSPPDLATTLPGQPVADFCDHDGRS